MTGNYNKFRDLLLANEADAVFILDIHGVIIAANSVAGDFLGRTCSELADVVFRDLVAAEDRVDAEDFLDDLLAHAAKRGRLECRFLRGDGHILQVLLHGSNLLSDPGVEGILINVRDLTRQRECEAQLQFSRSMEALGQLVGGVVHEFSNLLTVVVNNVQFALENVPRENQAWQDLCSACGAADRAGVLARQLLSFSRQDALEPARLSLNAVVKQALLMLDRHLPAHIECRHILCPGSGIVLGHEAQLVQVVFNLMANARDAMPNGGVLTIETGRLESKPDKFKKLSAGKYLFIGVADTGMGMTDDAMHQIFNPFFTTKKDRSGLGLSAVHDVVKRHSGELFVESSPRQGTKFTLCFPAVE